MMISTNAMGRPNTGMFAANCQPKASKSVAGLSQRAMRTTNIEMIDTATRPNAT